MDSRLLFDGIPKEIKLWIYSFLELKDLCALRLVNKENYDLSSEDDLWRRHFLKIAPRSNSKTNHCRFKYQCFHMTYDALMNWVDGIFREKWQTFILRKQEVPNEIDIENFRQSILGVLGNYQDCKQSKVNFLFSNSHPEVSLKEIRKKLQNIYDNHSALNFFEFLLKLSKNSAALNIFIRDENNRKNKLINCIQEVVDVVIQQLSPLLAHYYEHHYETSPFYLDSQKTIFAINSKIRKFFSEQEALNLYLKDYQILYQTNVRRESQEMMPLPLLQSLILLELSLQKKLLEHIANMEDEDCTNPREDLKTDRAVTKKKIEKVLANYSLENIKQISLADQFRLIKIANKRYFSELIDEISEIIQTNRENLTVNNNSAIVAKAPLPTSGARVL